MSIKSAASASSTGYVKFQALVKLAASKATSVETALADYLIMPLKLDLRIFCGSAGSQRILDS